MRHPLTLMSLAALPLIGGCSDVTQGFGLGSRASDTQLAEWTCPAVGPIDANGDQYVQSAEWALYARRAYSAWDEDGNGRVTRGEFDNCWVDRAFTPIATPAAAETAWTTFNTDGDDHLDSYEFWGQAAWARVDANRNGVADSGEWTW